MLIIILSVVIINLTHNCLKLLIQTGGLNSQFVQSWLFFPTLFASKANFLSLK